MRSRRSWVFALLTFEAALFALACSSDEAPPGSRESGGTGGTSAGMASGARGGAMPVAGTNARGGAPGSTGGTSGSGGSSGAGQGGAAAGGGASGMGGTAPGSGGMPGSGGTTASGGVGGGASGMGGDGAGTAGTAGDSAGASGTAGAGGSGSNLHGGASGAYVCPANPGTGDPLAGMSSITTIGPPTMTQPSFFAFIEGPVWVASLGKLFFSDNAGSPERIWQLTPGMTPSVFFEGSGSNGLAIDGDDQLVVTDQVGNRITRVDPTSASPSHVLIAAAGSKPNDIIVRSDGNIYFTAPNGSGTGFYRIDPSGMRSAARTEVGSPNGIVLSPDESTLYVGDVSNRSITAFAVAADGSIGESGTPFATTVSDTTDGMCVDCAGNVYAGTQNGVEVFSSTGTPRGTVMVGEASNCTFGGTDRRTLYVTSRNLIKAVTLAIPGLPD